MFDPNDTFNNAIAQEIANEAIEWVPRSIEHYETAVARLDAMLEADICKGQYGERVKVARKRVEGWLEFERSLLEPEAEEEDGDEEGAGGDD